MSKIQVQWKEKYKNIYSIALGDIGSYNDRSFVVIKKVVYFGAYIQNRYVNIDIRYVDNDFVNDEEIDYEIGLDARKVEILNDCINCRVKDYV